MALNRSFSAQISDASSQFHQSGPRHAGLCRGSLVADVIDRVPQLGSRAAYLKQWLRDKHIEHRQYITERGVDMPEVTEWAWGKTTD